MKPRCHDVKPPRRLDVTNVTNRTLDDVISARNTRPVVAVLLSQVAASAVSGDVFAEILADAGLPVLRTRIPRLERFAQSFGRDVSPGIYCDVAEELLTSVKRYKPGSRV